MDDTATNTDGTPRAPVTVYFPGPAPDPDAIDAKQRLAESVRELIEQIVTLDASASGAAAIEEAARDVAGARAAMERLPKLEHGDHWQQSRESSLHERGPFTGLSNPIASPLHLDRVGDTTTGWAVYATRTRATSAACTVARWRPRSTTSWVARSWLRPWRVVPER